MIRKFNIGFVVFSYGGNGGISSEVPDIREFLVPNICELAKDDRIDQIRMWTLADTPITMTRNRAVVQAREWGLDFLVMIDSDMKPDMYKDSGGKPFVKTSLDFAIDHYNKGPVAIGAPYCGPPPVECCYVFRWTNMANDNPNPDFQLEMYDRHTAAKMSGIQECAALPTGLIMYDMRVFDLTEPKAYGDKPWYYYEWKDQYCSEKASTEDVTQTRDISLAGTQKLGYSPVFCNWDSWAGHWKPKCVGMPQVIAAAAISEKLKDCWVANAEQGTKIIDFKGGPKLPEFNDLGMVLPTHDVMAIHRIVEEFIAEHGRGPTVLEVGSWAGASAIAFAKAGAASVTCVDNWLGNTSDSGCKVGPEEARKAFDENTKGYPIKAFFGTSPGCAEGFRDGEYDIVYIDANHTEEAVLADIRAWSRKAKHVIAGHDYGVFDGVAKAVDATFARFRVEGRVWTAKVSQNSSASA